jgi:Fe-S oxidoreductase
VSTGGSGPASTRLAGFASDLYHCADCGYCVDAVWSERGIDHVCPTITHHLPVASYSGRGYIAAARAWYEGAALDLDVLAERVFTCTGCGNCEQVCPIGLRPSQVGQALREELADRGHAPASVETLRATMRACGNPYGKPPSSRGAWANGHAFARQDATVLYAPGCAAAYGDPAETRAVVALLEAAGERVAWRGDDDRCCGAPLRELGLYDDARRAEQRLAADLPVARVVTSGLECRPIWRGVPGVQTMSFPEWLLGVLESGLLRARPRDYPRVSVFDGCANRRPGADGRADPLREVLARIGVDSVTDGLGAATAVCCGAAGGMPAMATASATRMAEARLEQTPAEVPVVCADPRCLAHLASAAGKGGARLLGLARFVHLHCEVEGIAHE